ncbi:DUF2087 domain-containing protein [uncultured Sneathia sp.]|uniref:DUF2087 domain-containing protein n=1 Tax=uncultured Sneathia sp. TaxID=278067 RepID=UPI002593DBD4|nr:DUF2087 domain-containing protein [uncultured Sneathia sp.]
MNNKFFVNDKLIKIPKKQNSKLEVFKIIYNKLENKEYTEMEINEELKKYFDDYALLRRYMIDLKFLKRDKYGKKYCKVKIKYEI